MNIFDQLKDIISDKKNLLSEDCEEEKEFVPFMVQRWLSFYSNSFANLVNISSNRLWKAVDNKQLWYKLFLGVIPQERIKRIKYIKKDSDQKNKKIDSEVIDYLAERSRLSKREVKQYIQTGLIDIKLIKKQIENN